MLFGVFGMGSVVVITVGRDACSSALQLETNLGLDIMRLWFWNKIATMMNDYPPSWKVEEGIVLCTQTNRIICCWIGIGGMMDAITSSLKTAQFNLYSSGMRPGMPRQASDGGDIRNAANAIYLLSKESIFQKRFKTANRGCYDVQQAR